MSHKILWTSGNLMMLVGLYLLLYVGGLFADEQYNVYAASGASDVVVPVEITAVPRAERVDAASAGSDVDLQRAAGTASAVVPLPTQRPRSRRLRIPAIENEPQDRLSNVVPAKAAAGEASTITRIVIPSIKVDKKVVEVGWTVQQDADGQAVAVWDVDKYRVGHHKGTSNPGGGGNIVLAGHSGGRAYPFNDLYYLKPGDQVQLYSAGKIYEYAVAEHILLDEVGQPLAKRRENARYIEPTDEEVVTMVACWPLTGPDKFKQRIVIRAKPISSASDAGESIDQPSGQATP